VRTKVDLYTICQDSEELLPHFLDYYDPWVQRIFVYLNTASRDGTREILEAHPKVHILPLETQGEFRDDLHRDIKNEAWKARRGEADWVVAVDDDEFLYHPEGIEEYLVRAMDRDLTVPEVVGYDMFSEVFPSTGTPITRQVVAGVPAAHMNKQVAFRPGAVEEMNYTVGSHSCGPTGEVRGDPEDPLWLLHYRFLGGLPRLQARWDQHGRRLSKINREMGWSIKRRDPEEIRRRYFLISREARPILPQD
jgi:hypothetical protein